MDLETYTQEKKEPNTSKYVITKSGQLYITVSMWLVIIVFRFEDLSNHPVIFIGAGVLASLVIHWIIQLWNMWQTHKR